MNQIQRIRKALCGHIRIGLMIVLFILVFPMSVRAQETGTIKGTSVNLREGVGTDTKVVTTLSQGTQFSVKKSAKDAAGKTWYQISFSQGDKTVQGYVIETYVNLSKTDTASQTQQTTTKTPTDSSQNQTVVESVSFKGTIKGTDVNIRKKAVSGSVLCKLGNKTAVTVKKQKKASDGQTWYYISFKLDGNTKKGWVRSDFVKKKEKTAVLDAQQDVVEVVDASNVTQVSSDSGVMNADNVNVRKKAVSGAVIAKLKVGDSVTIVSEKKASDGKIWYKIKFTAGGKSQTGYVRSDFVKRVLTMTTQSVQMPQQPEDEPAEVMTDAQFDAYIKQQGFPAGYIQPLKALHQKHPEWIFKAIDTKLSFEDVVKAESKVGMNFVSKSAIASWKSTEKTAYDWTKNSWYTFDGGSWVAASPEIIRYYLDPRNFLDETNVFQFETLEYEPYQNLEGIQKLLASSFMKGNFTEPDGTVKSYASAFLEVGKATGASPYHLAARCYQEQGKGTSDSISGKVAGLENYFNYYNIGAYASGGNSPTKQGLIYASKTASGAANYERPWNTRYRSILGGAQYVSQKYIKVGQNTLYFQKFNVVNTINGLYKHQYMTNLQAAASEATKMSKAYADQAGGLVFLIPLYKDMPNEVCKKPDSKLNPNHYLKTLAVTGQEDAFSFKPETENYELTVEKKVSSVNIAATPVATTSTVTGAGEIALERGENVIKVVCKAENGAEKTYTIKITRK